MTTEKASAEDLRLTQPTTDAAEAAFGRALTALGEMTEVHHSAVYYYPAVVQMECAKALCYELAAARAQFALLRNEVAEVSAEISHLRTSTPRDEYDQ